jgi:predicted component of type VI protein secretion system
MDVTLILFKKDGSQKAFPLPSSLTVIGRRHDCDLCVPLMTVSRRHCQLSLNSEAMKLRDLDSQAGTFLNSQRISDAIVKAGDYITIGPLTFLVQIDGEPKEIAPPQPAKPPEVEKKAPPLKSPPSKAPPKKAPADQASDSFPDLEIDDSDSFLTELKDI